MYKQIIASNIKYFIDNKKCAVLNDGTLLLQNQFMIKRGEG